MESKKYYVLMWQYKGETKPIYISEDLNDVMEKETTVRKTWSYVYTTVVDNSVMFPK